MRDWCAAFAALLCFAVVVPGQEFRGSLGGRVLDQQGAVVPGVKIQVTGSQTGARFQTTGGSDGSYLVPFLPPGPYRLSAEAAGFKRYINNAVQVTTNERQQLDITLEVGPLEQSVTITTEAEMLETATASTGQVITIRQIENMPMNGRTALVLAQLAYGVTPNSDPKFSRPFDNSGPSDFSMGGAPNRSNELLIDGTPDTTANNRVAYNPPIDAVQEVKVEVFQADAAYGHSGGGTVNVVMRGGTNTFHGTAYDFNQVSALAATPWFTNRSSQKKPPGTYNQYGVNAGAPLYIPRWFNGKNKVFWYFAYEGIRDAFPEPLNSTVPTAAERTGDFSALLGLGSNYQLYDPLTGVKEGSRVRRQPFSGNTLPADRLSSIAKAMLPFWPLPNQAGRPNGQDNYLSNSVRRDTFGSELGRLDFNLSERHKFFFNIRFNDRLENRSNRFNNIATGNFLGRKNWGTMIDDVYTIGSTTVLNTRLGWTRFVDSNTRPSSGYDFTKLGFPKYLAAASSKLVLPTIDLDQFTDIGNSGGDVTPFDIFQAFISLTKIHGHHALKFGIDLREYRESRASYGNSSGSYQFRPDLLRGPLDNSTSAPLGQDLASFLLGYPTGGSFDINTFRTNQAKYLALFIQDDIRASANLTFNIGLRLERDFGTTERFNRTLNGWDYTSASPIAQQAAANLAAKPVANLPSGWKLVGGPVFASSSNREVYKPKEAYFSPRFGFAWRPAGTSGKTVIRGGTGVFIFGLGTTGVYQNGFSQSTPILGAGYTGGLRPTSTLENPFPLGLQYPTGSSLGLATYLGRNIDFYNPTPNNPYSIRWTLNVQRQVTPNTVLEVGYTGNHAVHLGEEHQFNFVPMQYYSSLPYRDQPTIDRMTANVSNPMVDLLPGTNSNGATIQFQQLLKTFPHFGEVSRQSTSDGSSFFHGLQSRLERRFSQGLQALISYQFGRTLERLNRLNDFGPLQKRPADIDRPHMFTASFNYDLPFGRGRAIAADLPSVLNHAIGGWMVTGIYMYESGRVAGDWGNLIYYGGPLNWNPRNIDRVFDVTQFNRNSTQQLSWNVRTFPQRFGSLRRDAGNNVNCSILKNFQIYERVKLQFRTEFFNAFNHATFGNPNVGTASAANFGTINDVVNLERHIQMALRLSW
ncbi:MAG: TonB-dependent receptor [Acidobacteriales bacterium]|nr:TonB-dependent receptor [Terriglobales bacterium]